MIEKIYKKDKFCKLCGNEFIGHNLALYCSIECRKKYNYAMARINAEENIENSRRIGRENQKKNRLKNKEIYGTYCSPQQTEYHKCQSEVDRYMVHREFIFCKFRDNPNLVNRNYFAEVWQQRLEDMDSIFIDEMSKSVPEIVDLGTIINRLNRKIVEQNIYFKSKIND